MHPLEGGERNIRRHLTTYDPTSWTIIRGYMERTSGFVDEVFARITITPGVLFKTSELARLLLSLPGGENIRGQLTKYINEEAQSEL